jgi:autotransporter translocation and assembly factor TamB
MLPLLLSNKLRQSGLRMGEVEVEATLMVKVNLGGSHKLRRLGLRMEEVEFEATFMVKVNLGPTPTVKLESTFKLSGTLKVKVDLGLMVKLEFTLIKVSGTSVVGRQSRSAMPSTTAVTSHSSVSHRS